MTKLNIKLLIEDGIGNIWEKDGIKRLYINIWKLVNVNEISKKRKYLLEASRIWYDINSNQFDYKCYPEPNVRNVDCINIIRTLKEKYLE